MSRISYALSTALQPGLHAVLIRALRVQWPVKPDKWSLEFPSHSLHQPDIAKYVPYLVLVDQGGIDHSTSQELYEELTSLSRENLHWVRMALDDAELDSPKHCAEKALLLVDKKRY